MGILQPRRRRHVGWKDTGESKMSCGPGTFPFLRPELILIHLCSHTFSGENLMYTCMLEGWNL